MQPDIGVVLTPPDQTLLLQEHTAKPVNIEKEGTWKEVDNPKINLFCSICGKSFSQKSNLTRHLKQHAGIKPYVCSFNCGKSFSTASNCKRHELQHTNEFPFVCPYEGCERRFKSRSALNYHTKTHSGQKEYVCTFGDCKMKFLSRSNLKKHMLSHSQQADFHCPFCERKYKRKWDLSRHMKKAHQSRSGEENSDRFASILEQNLQQAEMINYLLERNKQLQEQLDGNVVRI